MKVFWIVLGHIVAIALLLALGLHLNGNSNSITTQYHGVISVFSVAFTCYTTFLNFWYRKSPKFHFTVNRVLLWFSKTHTYWQPHFQFSLGSGSDAAALNQSWTILQSGRYGRAVKKDETPTSFSVSLDDLLTMKFRVADSSLFVSFGHKLLVPSHLYDSYRQRLGRLVEDLVQVLKPDAMQCGVLIEFAEGKSNPYYGFFIHRVPTPLLEDFQATFRLDASSDCRIEADRRHINIEGSRLTEVLEALNQVLSLRELPSGDAR
jgi:hypothetical protein